jgi:SAM-dependent methyltransferase
VLDLACGPGRCAIELARRGFRVTGVDRTAFLLERAAERAREASLDVEWVRADMRDFVRPGAFSLVLNLFTSFGYFRDRGEDLVVLGRMLESLEPGAPCVIDVVGKECLARMYQPTTAELLPDGSRLVKQHEVGEDWSRLHEAWTVTRDGATQTFRYDHALYSGVELRERMQRAGFVGVRLYGGYDGEPYGPDAVCLIAIGRRPRP